MDLISEFIVKGTVGIALTFALAYGLFTLEETMEERRLLADLKSSYSIMCNVTGIPYAEDYLRRSQWKIDRRGTRIYNTSGQLKLHFNPSIPCFVVNNNAKL